MSYSPIGQFDGAGEGGRVLDSRIYSRNASYHGKLNASYFWSSWTTGENQQQDGFSTALMDGWVRERGGALGASYGFNFDALHNPPARNDHSAEAVHYRRLQRANLHNSHQDWRE